MARSKILTPTYGVPFSKASAVEIQPAFLEQPELRTETRTYFLNAQHFCYKLVTINIEFISEGPEIICCVVTLFIRNFTLLGRLSPN